MTDLPESTDITSLRVYLRSVEHMAALHGSPFKGAPFHTMEGYVLMRGQEYESSPLTDAEALWLFEVIDALGGRFPVKQCYANAQRVLLHVNDGALVEPCEDMKLEYVEGWAMGLIPVMHGWLLLNGKVVDLTLRLRKPLLRESKVCRRRLKDRALGQFPESRQYFGVVYPTAQVAERVRETGEWGTIIDDWRRGWPVLRAECVEPRDGTAAAREERTADN
jgi:hypothetical protein